MHTALSRATLAQAALPSLEDVADALRRAGAAFGRLWLNTIARIRQRRAMDELAQLDPHILRDLGVDYSELDSYQAEALGQAERTRLRVAMWTAGAAR